MDTTRGGPRSGSVESTTRSTRDIAQEQVDDEVELIDEEADRTPAEGHPDDREDELDGDDGGRMSVEAVHETPGHQQ